MSPPWTRGTKTAGELEDKIVRTWRAHGAKWVEGHGILANFTNTVYKIVPRGRVVIFLAEPGKCMYISAGRKIAARYFGNNQKLENFFRGKAGQAGIHHGNVLARTYFEGDRYPNMSVAFSDERFPSFGYVRRLPLRRPVVEDEWNLKHEGLPELGEVYTAIRKGNRLSLEDIMETLGRGVYIVSSCLPPSDYVKNRTPVNSPGGGKVGPVTTGLRRLRHAFPSVRAGGRHPRPGTLKKTHLPTARTFRFRTPKPRVTVPQVLRAIAENPTTSKWSMMNKLPANVNVRRLAETQRIYARKRETEKFISKLPRVSRVAWAATPRSLKPRFIHRRLKNLDAL
jgi:hypothetical protein